MGFVVLKRNGWKEIVDGDVSHSSMKLPTFRTVVVMDLFSLWFSSCLPFTLFCSIITEAAICSVEVGIHVDSTISCPEN
jgi:hypothetical protein